MMKDTSEVFFATTNAIFASDFVCSCIKLAALCELIITLVIYDKDTADEFFIASNAMLFSNLI